ncbi:MAG: hypothetical protein B6I34_03120 [Anaerolineaceae bacterium 4572_32.1]|nr:MAG: hypothetical protein B6I34_03120 [Anaerolineaceae bacterium 4572_32.1]
MNWQYTLYVIPLLIAAAISLSLVFLAWRRRSAPGAVPFMLLMLAVAEWTLGYALRLSSSDLPAKIFWSQVRYVGIVTVPTTWLVLTLRYTDREKWLTRRNLILLTIEPLVTLLLVWTNEFHHLIWDEIRLETVDSLQMWSATHGVAFWIHTAYSYLFILLGSFFLLQMLLRSPQLYRGQAAALLVGALAPAAGNVLVTFNLIPSLLDLTPFGFTIAGLAAAWGLFHFRLLDIVPVARRIIVDSMSDGVIVLDLQNRIVDINPAARRITSRLTSGTLGQTAAQILIEQIENRQDATDSHSGITLSEGSVRRHYDLRISPLKNQRRQPVGRLLVLRDVTEERLLEEMRQDLTHTMVHDLRNPLTTLSMSLGLLDVPHSNNLLPKQRAMLEIARTTIEKMTKLVNNILDVSRLESGLLPLERAPVLLDDLVDGVLPAQAILAAQKGLRLECDIPSTLPHVWVDARLIDRVLENLIGNAIKFTPAGGRVEVLAVADSSEVSVSISDTGPGIPPELQSRLFQKFTTGEREESGSGLGLVFCKLVIEAHDGRIWVESEPAHGATFTFILPIAQTGEHLAKKGE